MSHEPSTRARAVTPDFLAALAAARSRHDADALMEFMTDDGVLDASAGPEVDGTHYAGRDAVRGGT